MTLIWSLGGGGAMFVSGDIVARGTSLASFRVVSSCPRNVTWCPSSRRAWAMGSI